MVADCGMGKVRGAQFETNLVGHDFSRVSPNQLRVTEHCGCEGELVAGSCSILARIRNSVEMPGTRTRPRRSASGASDLQHLPGAAHPQHTRQLLSASLPAGQQPSRHRCGANCPGPINLLADSISTKTGTPLRKRYDVGASVVSIAAKFVHDVAHSLASQTMESMQCAGIFSTNR